MLEHFELSESHNISSLSVTNKKIKNREQTFQKQLTPSINCNCDELCL
jgi:hypothetical protein